MAVKEFSLTAANGGTNVPPRYHYCDTEAELPGGALEGALAYAADTNKFFGRTGGSWTDLGAGGSGTFAITQVEVDLGATPKHEGKFTVVDAGISSGSKISIWQAPGPYTGKGTRADEAVMDPLWCIAIPGSGSMEVHWKTLPILTPVLINDLTRGNLTTDREGPAYIMFTARLGKVKGNFKFQYTFA